MKRISIVQRLGFLYAFMFFAIVALNYVPGIHDAQGNMFGLFKLDPIDDALHLATAIWAVIAAWHSFKQSALYFKIFGIFYFADGIICLLLDQCLADFTIFTHGHMIETVSVANFVGRLPLNLPHIAIGGLAIWIGFWLSKKIRNEQYA